MTEELAVALAVQIETQVDVRDYNSRTSISKYMTCEILLINKSCVATILSNSVPWGSLKTISPTYFT